MNVVIIEDEKRTAQRLESLLLQYDPTIRVLAKLPSVAKSLAWFANPTPAEPDLLFLDIHLDDGSGFQFLEQAGLTLPIIFTTAYDQYALQAFRTNSIDYLLKPISAAELARAIDKFNRLWALPQRALMPDLTALMQTMKQTHSSYKDRFMVTIGTKSRSLPIGEIAYFFYENKATWLTTREGQPISIDYSLDKLDILLDPRQFFRVNRAFLVSLDAIQTVHTYSGSKLKVTLHPPARQDVLVSGERVAAFKIWLGK
ncbi:LytTR family DNA-binding domain-containing protein (plasmid) [Spirosoma sp. SC4-14]|uniref:LytR/AlgR family response regulator transcription factor n=1 Tax=Spirosoma sp. SC4-14 TaxID=3128900 RepID=UPI0030D0CAF3